MQRARLRRTDRKPWLWLAALAAFVCFGCGPVLYTTHVNAAERKLRQARDENARWYAPYEFYFAEEHLRQAQAEAAEASYEDAVRYAKTAEDYSVRALQIAARKRAIER